MLSGTGDVRREFMCLEQLTDEVEQLLKLLFSLFNQLLHSVSTHMDVQIQVIIFDCRYSVVSQSDSSEILLILYLFHNCTCIQYVTFKHNTH